MKNKILHFMYIVAAVQASVITTSPKTADTDESKVTKTVEASAKYAAISPKEVLTIDTEYSESGSSNTNTKSDFTTIFNQQLPQISKVEHTFLKQPSEVNGEAKKVKEDFDKVTGEFPSPKTFNQSINVKKDDNDISSDTAVINDNSTVIKLETTLKLDNVEGSTGTSKDAATTTLKDVVTSKVVETKSNSRINGNKTLTALQNIISMSAEGQLSPLFF